MSRYAHLRLTTAALLMAGAMLLPAHAQVRAQPGMAMAERERMAERMDRLENQLRDMQAVLYSVEDTRQQPIPVGGQPFDTVDLSTAESDMALRLLSLEKSLAELTGQVEELAFRMQRQQEAMARLQGMSSPEFGAASSMPAMSGPSNADQASGAPVDLMGGQSPQVSAEPIAVFVTIPDDPDQAYDEAFNAVLSADYDNAQDKLEAFVAKFPDAPQTAEVKYLLGEVYLATAAYNDAAEVFLDHVTSYPQDPRSPEAYLKLGESFRWLELPTEACRVLTAGVKKFPDMSPRLKSRYSDEQAKANCS